MNTTVTNINARKMLTNNYTIYLCTFLACFVPRASSEFKIYLGINISYYTIVVLVIWLLKVRRVVIRKRFECYFFFIWAAFIFFSIWRAEKIGVWAYYLDWVITAILLQQILIKFQNEDSFLFIIRALTDALFIHLLIGLYEVTMHTYLFETGNISRRLYGNVAISIFHNLNDYATFVTTMIPYAVFRYLNSKQFIEKIYSVFLVCISLYLMMLSESRGATLTLLVFICVGIYLFARRSTKNICITAAVLSAFVVILFFNIGGSREVFINFLNRNAIDSTGGSDLARLNLIKNGLYFLEITYGFGVGAGNLYEWLGERAIYPIGGLRFIHNWYVEVLVTFGVIFFVIYMIFHCKVMYKLYSKKYGTSIRKKVMFLSFVCFSIVSISSSSNVYSEWVWMYLVVVAMYVVSLRRQDSVIN